MNRMNRDRLSRYVDMKEMQPLQRTLERRRFLQLTGMAGLSTGTLGLLAACGGVKTSDSGGGANRTIKLGYVTPQTGALAAFGEADAFVINALKRVFANGVKVGKEVHQISVKVRDSQSDPKRAADVASELIQQQGVDLMLVASTPDTTNPVSDQCEANGVPCISTIAPWQAWYFGRGAKDSGFKWTYHFFWGLDNIIDVYTDMWQQAGLTGQSVAALLPNDSDGKAWSDSATGAVPLVKKAGYKIVDGGRYQDLSSDFSAQISTFKQAQAPLLLGVPLPPDFTRFWKQAAQQSYRPELATIAKALLFPSSVEALGTLGHNLGTEVWWSPQHPYRSSLTKQTARELGDAYSSDTGKQWTQPIGLVHALFEVALKALASCGDVNDKAAIAAAVGRLSLDTVAGRVDFTSGPVKNVAVTSLVGGQWRKGTKKPYDLVIVSNNKHPEIPDAGKVERLV
jgi:branched-chain amino acid transport system substrate-binding protein